MGKKKREVEGLKKEKKQPRRKTVSSKGGRTGYFLKRCFAFGVDWYLSTVLLNLASSLAFYMFSRDVAVINDVSSFSFGQSLVMFCFVLLTGLFYYVYVPMKVWRGQTPMQRMMQLKVVNLDGSDVSLKTMLYRYLVGCLIAEAALYSCSSVFINIMITHVFASFAELADLMIGIVIVSIAIISCVMALRDKEYSQTLHDRLAKTTVIDLFDPNAPTRAL